jgi:hypothetical protein
VLRSRFAGVSPTVTESCRCLYAFFVRHFIDEHFSSNCRTAIISKILEARTNTTTFETAPKLDTVSCLSASPR